MDTEPLKKLGLTDGEIKVYLALIRLGETTSGPLVDEAGVSVSKVYSILERLAKKGLASHIVKGNITYWQPASPRIYLDKISRDLERFNDKQDTLPAQYYHFSSCTLPAQLHKHDAGRCGDGALPACGAPE